MPCSTAELQAMPIVSSSPAWKPHATLALVTMPKSPASASKPSPTSALRSMGASMQKSRSPRSRPAAYSRPEGADSGLPARAMVSRVFYGDTDPSAATRASGPSRFGDAFLIALVDGRLRRAREPARADAYRRRVLDPGRVVPRRRAAPREPTARHRRGQRDAHPLPARADARTVQRVAGALPSGSSASRG